jgi:two-component system, chemotaxis family, chemotaxis protein CheY
VSRPRVLFVDDSATVRKAARLALESAGFEVIAAPDGNAALLYLIASTPDAIVVDELMPRLDGPALISSIRAVDRLRGAALVLASERVSTLVERARELSVEHALPKPFSPATIVATVSRALEDRARRKGDRHAIETSPSLAGRLDHVRLADVLRLLWQSGASGLVEVSGDDAITVCIWLRDGAIDLGSHAAGRSGIGAGDELRLARFLAERGVPADALALAGTSDRALGTALLRRGIVSAAELAAALGAQSRAIVREALARETGRFRFTKGAQSDEAENARLAIDPTELLPR